MRKVKIVLITLFFVFASTAMGQDDPMKGPWVGPALKDTHHERSYDLPNISAFLVKFFRKYVSPIDGSDCPMYPSCSRYSVECFEKHGFVVGWIMTWDRLYRCGRNELEVSPSILINGELKCYDPVENNDFWWGNGK